MGIEFIFVSALFALPVAGLPVLLHLLFRRKSPLIPFSTLRFIRMSVQHTAARRRVQRWLLLACRVLLMLLLIWAISQPARKLASSWLGGGKSIVAAIVVDTSYSMQLQDGQVTLLDKAGATVRDFLQGPLADAKVAIFTSRPSREPENFHKTGSQLAPKFFQSLEPQSSPVPLGDQAMSALHLLHGTLAQQKWLIIISDLQTREFPRPLWEFPEGRTVLIDLHPEEARNAGVTRVGLDPEQPLPGIGSEAIVDIAGRANESRAVSLSINKLDGAVLATRPPQMAAFDGAGHAQLRFPIQLPAQRWLLLQASLQGEDAMAWDNQRTHLLEVPPRQVVGLLPSTGQLAAQRYLKLALDPSEGTMATWPLDVKTETTPSGHENVVIAPITEWPSQASAQKLRDFAQSGGSVILCLEPGLEEAWSKLADPQKTTLLDLLPATPAATAARPATYRAGLASVIADPLLAGLTDDKFQLKAITIHRFVPFTSIDPAQAARVSAILNAVPATPGLPVHGLLFRRLVGSGVVYTLATLPDSSLATHPLFLPLVVRLSLRPSNQTQASNVELGESLVLAGPQYAALTTLYIDGPKSVATVKVDAVDDKDKGHRFVFNDAVKPGIYTWHLPTDPTPVALTNVVLPAGESELVYRQAPMVVHSNDRTLVARSFSELQQHIATLNEPQAMWSWPITIVLVLLCLEALMGSISKLWRPISWRSLMGAVAGQAAQA